MVGLKKLGGVRWSIRLFEMEYLTFGQYSVEATFETMSPELGCIDLEIHITLTSSNAK